MRSHPYAVPLPHEPFGIGVAIEPRRSPAALFRLRTTDRAPEGERHESIGVASDYGFVYLGGCHGECSMVVCSWNEKSRPDRTARMFRLCVAIATIAKIF
jgi:hypothetical protein